MLSSETPPPKLSTTDRLAIERTKLANERTFLAYFRTAFALMAGGVTIIRLESLQDMRVIGYFFLIIAPLVLLVGIWRLFSVRKHIQRHYQQ
jgi:putative membrane protein